MKIKRILVAGLAWVLSLAGAAAQSVNPPAGLAGWWPGDGHCFDLAGTNHGTPQGGVGFTSGEVGGAFHFDGTNDWVSLGTRSAFRQSGAITYAFWTRIPPGGGGYAVGAGCQGGQGYGGVSVSSNSFKFFWTPSSPVADANIAAQGITVPPGQWTHLAVAVDFGSQTRAMFVNGQAVATTASNYLGTPLSAWTPAASYSQGQPDAIGGRFINQWTWFAGELDEVCVFNRALSGPEIAALHAAGGAGMSRPNAVWIRKLDWTDRPASDEGTTNGNPDDDAEGNPVWQYEVVQGGPFGSANPWYAQPGTLMVWDDSWFGGGGVWAWRPEWSPATTADYLPHNLDNWSGLPVPTWFTNMALVRWVNRTGRSQVLWLGG